MFAIEGNERAGLIYVVEPVTLEHLPFVQEEKATVAVLLIIAPLALESVIIR